MLPPSKINLPNLSVIIEEQDFLPPAPPTTLAGRTAIHLANWAKITTDPWVLETVVGYKLELIDTPMQSHPPVTMVNQEMADKISVEVETMLEIGAILPIQDPLNKGFYSRIFLVPKKDGQSRPVVNLCPLNQHLLYQHFKMEGVHVVRDLLQQGDWMSRIDLKDAYFAIPIHKNHRQYLRFLWQNQAYKFTCLPFGLLQHRGCSPSSYAQLWAS